MNEHVLKSAQANIDLAIWNSEAESVKSRDLYLWLRESGLPHEVAFQLKKLVYRTRIVADHIISIGKIILIKIIEFIKAHPNLTIGIALGAAIGALVNMIPFLGSFLSPIAMALGVSIGVVAGHQLDKLKKGQTANAGGNLITISQDLIEIAKEFFKLLIDIFNAVFDKPVLKEV